MNVNVQEQQQQNYDSQNFDFDSIDLDNNAEPDQILKEIKIEELLCSNINSIEIDSDDVLSDLDPSSPIG